MKFSFCTNCKERLADLQKTLPRNLSLLHADEEIILLDYNSRDNLRLWVLTNFRFSLESGKLHLFSERTAPRFFMAHAKNVSHLMGHGEVLVNLDADNYLDVDYLKLIRENDWTQYPLIFPFTGSGGFKGRTAITQNVFRRYGGYDESLCLGYGFEELDLCLRTIESGLKSRDVKISSLSWIPTGMESKAAGQADKSLSPKQTNDKHMVISKRNRKAKRYIANTNRWWGVATLFDWQDKQIACGFNIPWVSSPVQVNGHPVKSCP